MYRGRRQRVCRLYPIELPVYYRLARPHPITGEGQTRAISSDLVRFECSDSLPLDQRIWLRLAWPAVLPDRTPLNLWIVGTVTKCLSGEVEIAVINYEFRTRPAVQRAESPALSDLALSLSPDRQTATSDTLASGWRVLTAR